MVESEQLKLRARMAAGVHRAVERLLERRELAARERRQQPGIDQRRLPCPGRAGHHQWHGVRRTERVSVRA